MNKITVGNEKIILDQNATFYLNIPKKDNLIITVYPNIHAKLVLVSENDYDICYSLKENSELIVNSLNKDNNVNIEINLEKNTNIIYNHSVLGKNNSVNSFKIVHNDSNSNSMINNNGINILDNKLYFNVDGIILKDLVNINCSQSSQIINFGNGDAKIIPNLIIDSNDINASHSAYIGKIEDEQVFYLKSRGLDFESIKKLIYKSVLLSKMILNEEEEEFNKRINEWW